MKREKGITLVALIVTIIILLILTWDNGTITKVNYAKFATEIREIQEQLELKNIREDYSIFGKINDELEIKSSYNDLLYIEEELVYVSSKASKKEKKG